MPKDAVDKMLNQWTTQRPELDTDGLSVVARILKLNKPLRRQATEALASEGLELWEYDVLSALRRQGAPYQLAATGLARATSLSSGAMTNRIDRLEDKAFVKRKPDLNDKRGVIISLTRSGRRTIDKAIKGRLAAANESVRGLTHAERRKLVTLLRKVALSSGFDDAQ